MSDTQEKDDATGQLRVENALLRGSLWLTTRALRDYRESKHTPVQGDAGEQFQLTVPSSLPGRADDALARAQAMLTQESQPAKATQQPGEQAEFQEPAEGIDIINNHHRNRLEIVFAGKPSVEMAALLKTEGWKRSRKDGSWQRELSGEAQESARRITGLG